MIGATEASISDLIKPDYNLHEVYYGSLEKVTSDIDNFANMIECLSEFSMFED